MSVLKLVTPSGNVIRSVHTGAFDTDSYKSRAKAFAYMESEKNGWEVVASQIGRPDFTSLRIVEIA